MDTSTMWFSAAIWWMGSSLFKKKIILANERWGDQYSYNKKIIPASTF